MADKQRAIPEVSLDTQVLERLLMTAEIGQIISYDTLSAAIGRDVQREARHHLSSARRRVLRDPLRMLFEPVVNVGMKRLDDTGKIATGFSHLQRSRNQARFAQIKTKSVDDFNALPNDQKIQHNLILAQSGTLRYLTSARMTKKLEHNITEPHKEMPLRQCLKAMAPLV